MVRLDGTPLHTYGSGLLNTEPSMNEMPSLGSSTSGAGVGAASAAPIWMSPKPVAGS